MNFLIIGGSDGMGKAFCKLLDSKKINYYAPTKEELDITDYEKIDKFDLSKYNNCVNFAGTTIGTWRGLEENSWQNHKKQIETNLLAPMLLAKQWIKTNGNGKFVQIISTCILQTPRSYNAFYSISKEAMHLAIKNFQKNYPNIKWIEINPGKTKTGQILKGYEGTKTKEQVENEFAKEKCLTPDEVAEKIWYAIENYIPRMDIIPSTNELTI